jgi:4,5-dihydroxyphthalate decarboxylase
VKITVRLALRDWDYMTPLVLGDVHSERLDVQVDRVAALPEDFANDPRYDASEISFSRYITGRARGEKSVIGVPNFLMRGFRHRCIITARNSPLTRLEELKGKRIGVTGWQDSGNTWTRAAVSAAGVGVEDAYWYAGRLTEAHPITDRLGIYARPGRIEAVPGERPMLELLESGELDAVFTPFMPPGFFETGSRFRHLLTDLRGAELAYFKTVGYIPGIHVLGIKVGFAAEHPWLPQELSDLLDESQRVWLEKRRKYADTTPWIIEEFAHIGRDLPADWNASGLEPNRRMIAGFLAEIRSQKLADTDLTPDDLFPAVPSLVGEPA